MDLSTQPSSGNGIHHVTAIASSAQRNFEFYSKFLGLRLVKRTVNFDDPQTYHLYYGDELGRPGTILTFFPWEGMRRGQRGVGQVAAVSLTVPQASLGFWLARFSARNLHYARAERFGQPYLAFEDPDGLSLELTGHAAAADIPPWEAGPVEPTHAVRGVYGVTLWEDAVDRTEAILTDRLGCRKLGEERGFHRYIFSDVAMGGCVDVRRAEGFWPNILGAGSVHHVAFRTRDETSQLELRRTLYEGGLEPTPVIDRQYFRSVYFREPGGVLFEIATDPPGFSVDESPDELGTSLKLPPQYESMRAELEASLPPLSEPAAGDGFSATVPELSFVYLWLPHSGAHRTLLLLHGTGGDENQLVPLGQRLAPDASILSLRGKVLENGMHRFFERLAEGIFDQKDLARQAKALAEFIEEAAQRYSFDLSQTFAVGYSNGANIAAAALLLSPGVLGGAILFRPMVPFEPSNLPDLAGMPVFISAGRYDPLVPVENAQRLRELLTQAGADVTYHLEPARHNLEDAELEVAGKWLATLK